MKAGMASGNQEFVGVRKLTPTYRLPASAVQQLLAELRREGRVALSGQRRWARWKLAASGQAAGDA